MLDSLYDNSIMGFLFEWKTKDERKLSCTFFEMVLESNDSVIWGSICAIVAERKEERESMCNWRLLWWKPCAMQLEIRLEALMAPNYNKMTFMSESFDMDWVFFSTAQWILLSRLFFIIVFFSSCHIFAQNPFRRLQIDMIKFLRGRFLPRLRVRPCSISQFLPSVKNCGLGEW